MFNLFNWGFGSTRTAVQIIAALAVFIPYIYIIALDFKYREMEYWKILIASIINIIVPYIPVAIWGCRNVAKHPVYIIPIFAVLSIINGIINRETVVGKADIDVFISQILISSLFIATTSSSDDRALYMMNASIVMQAIFGSILIGLLITVFIWFVNVLIYKHKNKGINIIEAININREVPTLIAFLPWIALNIYMVMSV